MDPALAELIEAGDPDDEVRVVARLAPGAGLPPGAEVVSQFGDVATLLIERGDLRAAWESPTTVSVKAPQTFDHDPAGGWYDPGPPGTEGPGADDERRPEGLPETGKGVIVACLDWGVDFAHPDFRTATGATRLLALWDQRSGSKTGITPRYGYGVVHDRSAIDAALATSDPYKALGYHPADADLGHGSHGTHCLSIAAGGGGDTTPTGVAPAADLLFVHLDSPRGGSGQSLGDWVTLLDALDFCLGIAGARPIVISMSLGSEGGPHDGSSPLERALDYAVSAAPGRAICQSTGNYYEARTHTAGRLRPGEQDRIGWLTTRAQTNPHQLEVWYAGADRIVARIESREYGLSVTVAPGESRGLELDGVTIGRIHHRTDEPNNHKNHINAFLYPAAPGGRWDVVLAAADVADGRYHCWVERESAAPGEQSHLDETEIVKRYTTNSVCNGLRTITVGAYDARAPDRPPAPFSSAGPTSDGRAKPGLGAPGVRVLAARSTPRGEAPGDRSTQMSGTSMAAPCVAGTVALMFEAAGRPMTIAETRRHLSRTAEAADATEDPELRIGDGYVDIEAAVAAARASRTEPKEEEPDMKPMAAGAVVEQLGMTPAATFDALRSGAPIEQLTVIAAPGAKLSVDPRGGDILLSRVRGEHDVGRLAVLHDGTVHDRERCRALGDVLHDNGPGLYVHVIGDGVHVIGDGGEIVAVRIADIGGRLPLGHMLIRTAGALAPLGTAGSQGEGWDEAVAAWAPESGPVTQGRLVVDEVPLLSSHHGTHPDLILHWNAMPADVSAVDIVVHFHGWSGNGARMRLDVDKEPKSGLDFSNPADPSDTRPGRSRPTLCILPRGNFVSGRRYTHPALITPTGLQDLISFALDRFRNETGAQPTPGRLILTAHSGGGAGLMGALRHNDPHEIHTFDALYGPAGRLSDWALKRIRIEDSVGETGALRIVFRDGEGTAANSRAVAEAIAGALASSRVSGIADRYRAQATTVEHNDIPPRFGWLLLADAAAPLPLRGAGRPAEFVDAALNGGAPATAEDDEDTLRAQWDAHSKVHGFFDGGFPTYVSMAPLFANNGIPDAAAYLAQTIVTAHFCGRTFPAHTVLAAALAQADAGLKAATPPPDVHSAWAVNARPIRGRSSSLSKHALGLAVDINPDTNPLIRASDDRDVVLVIKAVTEVDLGTTQTADAMRQASLTFRATYGDDWLAARRQELDAAVQAADTARSAELQKLLTAAKRQAKRLKQLAQTGFFDLDQRLIDALVGAGLTWGGSWRTSKDFMHFEISLPAPPPATQAVEDFVIAEQPPWAGEYRELFVAEDPGQSRDQGAEPTVSPVQATASEAAALSELDTGSAIAARILWPALGCPAVVAPRQDPPADPTQSGVQHRITVLLLSDREHLTADDAASHLRLVPWDRRASRQQAGTFDPQELGVRDAGALSRPQSDDRGDAVVFGASRYEDSVCASLAKRVRDFYKANGLTHLHQITVSEGATARLTDGQYHVFWETPGDQDDEPSAELQFLIERFAAPRRLGAGDDDYWQRFHREHRDFLLDEYRYEYGFLHEPYKVGPPQKRLTEVLHPVFVRRDTAPLQLAHLTDTHVDTRQNIYEHNLKVSHEPMTWDGTTLRYRGRELRFNNTNQSFEKLYEFAKRTADVILMTGDLIDYGRGHIGQSVMPDGQIIEHPLWDLGAYHTDRNWFLFYYLLASRGGYARPVYTSLGNHDWRLNPYPPFTSGAPGTDEMVHNYGTFTPEEQKEIIQIAHGPGFDGLLYPSQKFGLDLFTRGLAFHTSPLETDVESIAWYLLLINPFLDYALPMPGGQQLLMLDWGKDEDVDQHTPWAGDYGTPSEANVLSPLQHWHVEQFTQSQGAAKVIGKHAPPLGPFKYWTDEDVARGEVTYSFYQARYLFADLKVPITTHTLCAIQPHNQPRRVAAVFGSMNRDRDWFIEQVAGAHCGVRLVLSGHIHREGLLATVRGTNGDGRLLKAVRHADVTDIGPGMAARRPGSEARYPSPLYVNTASAGPRPNLVGASRVQQAPPAFHVVTLAGTGVIGGIRQTELPEPNHLPPLTAGTPATPQPKAQSAEVLVPAG